MPYQTAIFDLDGTLLNTLDDLYNAVNHSLVAYGLPKRSLAEVRLFTGNGIRRLIDLSVPKGTPSHLTDQVFGEFKTYYDAHKLDTTRPYTGMTEVIDDLRAANVACAVVSNKADFAVQGIIDHFYPSRGEARTAWPTWATPRSTSRRPRTAAARAYPARGASATGSGSWSTAPPRSLTRPQSWRQRSSRSTGITQRAGAAPHRSS